HAVTKFAHIHFPASQQAMERIINLGERPEDVHLVGCPRIDLVEEILQDENGHLGSIFERGVGGRIDLNRPFLLVSQHPVTTEYGKGEQQILATLQAVRETGLPTVMLWPNADAGSDDVARGIRKWREQGLDKNMHFFKNLSMETYTRLMKKTVCLVGNSSSGIREGAFIGTPVVNIGSRQDMRERGQNVIDVPHKCKAIAESIYRQINHVPYQKEAIYGDGTAGKKIADILATCKWQIQKRITY
ncbi:hypothetical protein LCGC14_2079580, partial [marine sediment metagenome]